MGASFLITLREGLEVSLVLAILITYLVRTDRRDAVRSVWMGAAIAAIGCIIVGIIVNAAVGGLHGKSEQAVEGTIAITACAVLTWMVFWMRRNARSIGGELRTRIDLATSAGAIVGIAFVAVVREGRGDRLKETPETFSGLFWSGQQAIEIGLADGYGTLDSVARDVVKAEDIVDYSRQDNVAERLAKRFGAAMGEAMVKASLNLVPHLR